MIYLDNAATTKPNKEVLKVFCDVSADDFFNASAQYSPAFDLNMRVMNARKKFIQLLGGDEEGDNFVFTSGATESNNLAIFGSAINKKMTISFHTANTHLFSTLQRNFMSVALMLSLCLCNQTDKLTIPLLKI